MRLTCPNCGAEYELPEGLIPPGGKHVQCSACHTRWFMRAATPRALSEDQILQRLEARTTRPRPVLVPVPTEPGEPPAEPPTEPAAAASAAEPDFAWEAPEAEPEPEPTPEPDLPEVEPEPASPAVEPTPMLRSAPRLELSARPAALPKPAARSRFGRGLVLALLVAGLAVAVYVWRDGLSRAVPPAAGALQGYGDAIDGARGWLDQLAGPKP